MPRKPNWQISSNLAALVIGVLTTFITLAGTAIAQNPVPLLDQPLVPDATAPGGPAFTLTVYGAGFVPASVVNWNGSPRSTTYVSSHQLTAAILASDIATASTASVTVANPSPGGGVSNIQFHSVTVPATSVSFLPPAETYRSGGSIDQGVAVADLNGDGILDMVVSSYSGVVGVLLGNGNGTFQPVVTYKTGGTSDYFVTVADVNGDGKPDIIVSACAPAGGDCGSVDGLVSVLLGNGNGTFQKALTYDTGAVKASAVSVADVNGDGKLDLIVTNWYGAANGDGTVSVLLGNGDGTYQKAVTYDSGGPQANGQGVADVNGDGIPDIVAVNYYSSGSVEGSIGVLIGKGDGTFQPTVTYLTGGNQASGIALGDVNHDGYPDVIVGNLANPTVGVLLNAGNGQYEPAVTYNSLGDINMVAVGDLNGDGNLDIIAPTNSDVVSVLLGTGNGTFQPAVGFPIGGSDCNTVAVGDVNGDGKLDIVTTIGFSNLVAALLNNTGPSLPPTTTTLTSSPNPSTYGQTVSLTATVTANSGTPMGTVLFYEGSTQIGAGTLTNGTTATLVSTLPVGSDSITAAYQGSSTFAASTSATLRQIVNSTSKPATTTSLTSGLNPSTYGQPVTLTAAVTGTGSVPPTGKVAFVWSDNGIEYTIGTATLSASGVASLSKSNLNADTYPIVALYGGDANNLGSRSPVLNQVVNQATSAATLTSSPNPSALGESVTLKAKFTSPTFVAKGPVTFTAGKTVLGTVELSGGDAKLVTAMLPAGSNTVTVTYAGDSDVKGSSASVTQVVQ